MQVWSESGCVDLNFADRQVTHIAPTDLLRYGPSLIARATQPHADVNQLKQDLFKSFLKVQQIPLLHQDALTAELQQFVDCVRTRSSPRCQADKDSRRWKWRNGCSLRSPIINGMDVHTAWSAHSHSSQTAAARQVDRSTSGRQSPFSVYVSKPRMELFSHRRGIRSWIAFGMSTPLIARVVPRSAAGNRVRKQHNPSTRSVEGSVDCLCRTGGFPDR